MTKARDLKVGDLVRFRDAEDQPAASPRCMEFFGHLCLIEDLLIDKWDYEGEEYDCVSIRSIATGETTICWAARLETIKRSK